MTENLPDAPPSPRRRGRAVVVALGFGTLLAVGGWWAGRDLTAAAPPARAPLGGARLFDQVVAAVAQKYVDSIPPDSIFAKSVTGMLNELQDPFTSFLAEDRLRRLSEQMNGTFSGIGLQIDIRDGWPVVIEPLPGGPSERAGVLAGDRILRIGKESTKDLDRDEVSSRVRGPTGSPVTFTVQRGDQQISFTIIRDKVHLRAVQRAAMLPGNVGYVDVNVFNAFTVEELASAVDSLVRQGARSLVMDLRGNPGGLLEQGVAVAELFLDRGQSIVQLRGRPGTPPQTYTDSLPQRWPTLPLAVLVDRASASASEIVAGALQDHDRAVVLGVTSFGKGSAQNVYPLSNGGALRLTIARWFTPVGRSISRAPDPDSEFDDEVDSSGVSLPDTIRPQFRTDAGRTVFGGGGITPDVVVGDTTAPLPVQALARAMGKKLGAYQDALAKVGQLHRRTMTSPNESVTPELLDELYADLVRRRVAPPRAVFDSAGPWIARSLGYEMTRQAFGSDAEFMRRSQHDATLLRATQLLTGSRAPRDVFKNVERR